MVLRYGQPSHPEMLQLYLAELRKAPAQQLQIHGPGLGTALFVGVQAGRIFKALADHQPAVLGQPQRRTRNAVGRRHPPGHVAAQAGDLCVGQRVGQAGEQQHRHLALPVHAERLRKGIHGQDQLAGANTSLGSAHIGRSALELGLDDRRSLEQLHLRRKTVRQATHQRGRIQQVRARGINGCCVIVGTQTVAQRGTLQVFVGLAPGVQIARIRRKRLGRHVVGHGHVVAATLVPVAGDAVLGHQAVQRVDCKAVDTNHAAALLDGCVGRGRAVRQVNGEAGIATRRVFSDHARFHHRYGGVRLLQGELAGSGKPGVPCADNDPVNIQVTLQRGAWLARACQGTPSVGAIIIGQIRDTARHLCHLLAPNTAERGRNCKQQ